MCFRLRLRGCCKVQWFRRIMAAAAAYIILWNPLFYSGLFLCASVFEICCFAACRLCKRRVQKADDLRIY